ncbi:MAG: hypothetical protein NVS9B7_16990 [Flavisolibacter sp.]
MKNLIVFFFSFIVFTSFVKAQQPHTLSQQILKLNPHPDPNFQRCGTAEAYNLLFKKYPGFQRKFETNQRKINASLHTNSIQKINAKHDTLTVVIHLIANDSTQSLATDAVLFSQIDVLNEDYNAANADSVRIPPAFKKLFGNMGLVFQLARTDPDGLPTNGIERRINNIRFDLNNYDNAKSFETGGLDGWDPAQYINIWVGDFASNSGLLGISVFPGDPRPTSLHGILCDFRAFGRGASYLFSNYNTGKTVSHELGHFFNLIHIWGDGVGDCLASDFPNAPPGQDDTPNQGNFTSGNPDVPGKGTVVTDPCSPAPPGIMYQNYMDYTDDVALVMFTNGQVSRMQTALRNSPDRNPLLNSSAFHPPVVYSYDARLKKILSPRLNFVYCNQQINPTIKLRNQGTNTITTIAITTVINNISSTSSYMVNLPYNTDTLLVLHTLQGAMGNNFLVVYSTLPNGQIDQNPINDTVKSNFKVKPVMALPNHVEEGFDSPLFPPQNWDVFNPNKDMTWQWNANYGANKIGSAWINDFNNPSFGHYDDLVLPNYSFQNKDSIFLNFHVAAAVFSDPKTTSIPLDTLAILLSKDCGNTYKTIYKKWGVALQTTSQPTVADTIEFFPNSNNWRNDSVNIGQWLDHSENQFQLAFRFTGNFENNLFLDDIGISTKVLPTALKKLGYLVLPTVFQNQIAIWHYKPPNDLKYISIYNSAGQLVWTKQFAGNADNYINIDLSSLSKGIYIISAGYSDKKNMIQRIIKN